MYMYRCTGTLSVYTDHTDPNNNHTQHFVILSSFQVVVNPCLHSAKPWSITLASPHHEYSCLLFLLMFGGLSSAIDRAWASELEF